MGLFILLSSCHTYNTKDQEIPRVRFDLTDKQAYLSNYADSVAYIRLGGNGEVLISGKLDMKFSPTNILVVDKGAKRLFLFKKDGTFLTQISNLGAAPQEYGALSSAAFSPDGASILILDALKKKIFFFGINGHFIKEIKLNEQFRNIWPLDDKRILIFSGTGITDSQKDYPNILVIDYQGNILMRQHLEAPFKWNVVSLAKWYKYEGADCIFQSTSDTVFIFNKNNKLIPKYRLVHEDMPDKHAAGFTPEQYMRKGMDPGVPIESKHLIFSKGNYNGIMKYYFYEKDQKKGYNLHYSLDEKVFERSLMNDIDGGPPFWPSGQIDENVLYRIFDPQSFLSLYKNKIAADSIIRDQAANERFKAMIAQVKEEDNPIIQLVYFKK